MSNNSSCDRKPFQKYVITHRSLESDRRYKSCEAIKVCLAGHKCGIGSNTAVDKLEIPFVRRLGTTETWTLFMCWCHG